MAQPGWYPDPAGSGRRRYWDGRAWAPQPTEQHRRPDSLIWWVTGIVLASIVVVLALWQPWRGPIFPVPEDTNSASPSVPSWDETSAPSASPEPTESSLPTDGGGRPVACPEGNGRVLNVSADGRYRSGGLSFEPVRGWGNSRGYALDMANDVAGQRDPVVDTWIALTAIGWLDTEHFGKPQQAATQVIDCLSTSFYYRDMERREVLSSEAHDVGGRPGWLVRANLWNRQPHPVLGDEIIVLVVDTGRAGQLAIFHAEAPIRDQRRIDLINKALDSVRVE